MKDFEEKLIEVLEDLVVKVDDLKWELSEANKTREIASGLYEVKKSIDDIYSII